MQEILPPKNKAYADLEFLAKLMDDQFQLFGYRFGLNFIIDLLPEIGDIITTIIALYIFSRAVKLGVPKATMLRMLLNIAVYFFVGLVPWAGDIFGVWWKPNRRNLELVRRALES